MSDIHKNPKDIIDLSVAAPFNDGDFATIGCRAYVLDPNGVAVTGSPFALVYNSAGYLFQLKSAFQADVSSGTYDVTYIFYTDGTYASEHGSYGHEHDTITISIQSTTGLGGGGMLEFDEEALVKVVKRELKKMLEDEFSPIRTDIKNITDRDFVIDLDPLLKEIAGIPGKISLPDLSGVLQSIIESRKITNNQLDKLRESVKRNSSHIIKSSESINKNLFVPVISSVETMKRETIKSIKDAEQSVYSNNSKVISEIQKFDIQDNLKDSEKRVGIMLDNLNEGIRKKLKFALDAIINMVIMGRKLKQQINIELKEKK